MRVELINTGSELMLGFTVNTHLSYIARQLAEIGLRLNRQVTVADDRAEMRAAIEQALQHSEALIITGGLGPTSDDFTRDVVAELLGRKLVRDEAVASHIAERIRNRRIRLPESVYVQALVPVGAQVLPNRNGTAPGLAIDEGGKLVLLLPGPPRELKPMFEEYVLPVLQKHLGAQARFDCRTFKVVGLAESIVEEKVAPVLADLPDIELGYSAKMGEVEVRIISGVKFTADEAEKRIRTALADNIYGTGDARLEETVVKMLVAVHQTIAVAESCTGGAIANRITNVSGSSKVFINGCVTYSDESKTRLLGVSEKTLVAHGTVSEEVAREMAESVRKDSGADFGISTTGIAGPTGGTPEKPVGLVYIGFATSKGSTVQRHVLALDRETFKFFVAQYALDAVRRELLQEMIRAFIAIDLPDDIRVAIEEAQTRLKQTPMGVKISWTKVANLHLTLQFLGGIQQAAVDKLKAAVRPVVAKHQPFNVSVRGAGAFPNEKRPRVVWIGCEDEGGKLNALAGAVQEAMKPLGFVPQHHGFSAHLTLGRIKSPRPDAALTRAVDSLKDTAFGTLRVEAIHLFESQLHPEGSIYTKLSSHALGAHN